MMAENISRSTYTEKVNTTIVILMYILRPAGVHRQLIDSVIAKRDYNALHRIRYPLETE